jgi:hypothetical protein
VAEEAGWGVGDDELEPMPVLLGVGPVAGILPDLNPVEECWRHLESALGNRYFESITDLTKTIDASLGQLILPEVSNYF